MYGIPPKFAIRYRLDSRYPLHLDNGSDRLILDNLQRLRAAFAFVKLVALRK